MPPKRHHYYYPALAAILAGYLVLSLVALREFQAGPFATVPMIDEESYVAWAADIAADSGQDRAVFYQDPLYPYLLALVFAVFGKSFTAVRLLQIGLGAGGVILAADAARRVAGRPAGIITALVLALSACIYYYALLLLKAQTAFFLGALLCAVGAAAAERPGRKVLWPLLGLALGLLGLVRGNALVLVPFAIAWAAIGVAEASKKDRVLRALLVLAGFLAVIAPVAVRNYLVGGEFVITTSQAGANFYIGNNPEANGRYHAPRFVRAHPRFEAQDFAREAERRSQRSLRPAEVSRFWMRESIGWIAAHPRAALGLTIHKARLLIGQYEIPDNHSFYLVRENLVPALRAPLIGHGLLWGPALVGIVLALGRNRRAGFPALFLLLYAASLVPFFIVSRYRMAVMAPLALFASVFIVRTAELAARRQWRALVPALAGAALVCAAGFWPTPESRAPRAEEYYLLGEAYLEAGQPGPALDWYDRALAGHPDFAAARAGWIEAVRSLGPPDRDRLTARALADLAPDQLDALGRKLRELELWDDAARVYREILRRDPASFEAHTFLGYVHAQVPSLKDLDQALDHYRAALALRPGDLAIKVRLADCLREAGRPEEARLLYNEVLTADPDHAAARRGLGQLDSGPRLPP